MPAEAAKAKKILIVDDEKDVCTYLSRIFEGLR